MGLSRIVDVDGNPINMPELKTPQTAEYAQLHREFQGHPARGLTPSKLAGILVRAEHGDIISQYELFEDMEERDAHIMSEMSKRKLAVCGLDWSIVPPKNPTAAERDNAEQLNELIDGLDDFEDVQMDMADAIGKAFSCQEMDWEQIDGYWLPSTIVQRPQTWFTLHRGYTQEIRLRGPADGEPLRPFNWLVHTHKAKSGWLERSALFRVLVWPYLFKNYSVGDLAEFLEIYGIPLRVGKFNSGATEKEKRTLLRALSQIGHNAAGIIPQGMDIEFHDAATGDPGAFNAMIDWCEKSQSKAILGGTLTSQADGKTSTNALGSVHNEVRKELRDSDAKQLAKSISRHLLYPIAVLNGLTQNWARCPRFKFDVNECEDMQSMSSALPTFVDMGFRISRQWAQERVGIPEPSDDEDVLARNAPPITEGPMPQAALNAELSIPQRTMADQLDDGLQSTTDAWIEKVRELVARAQSLDELRDSLSTLIPDMPIQQYADLMAEALRVAELTGRDDIMSEANAS